MPKTVVPSRPMLFMPASGWRIICHPAHHPARMTAIGEGGGPPLDIREIGPAEFALVWPIFQAVVAEGETYAYDPATTFEQARLLWTQPPARCFAARQGTEIVAAYCLKPNQPGLGDHVANAGYMVAP